MTPSLKYVRQTFKRQHDQSDCGVACLLSIIKYHGGNQSLEKLREESGTSISGTTMLGIYQCAEKNGLKVDGVEMDFEHLRQQQTPCILHVTLEGRMQHYVVYYGECQNSHPGQRRFLIGDPGKGVVEMNEAELSQIWCSKAALLLVPGTDFILQKTEMKNKWQWFKNLIEEDVNILVITVVLGLMTTIAGLSLAIFSQRLIDVILPAGNMNRLIAGLVILLFILLLKSGLTYIRQLFVLQQSKAFNERITGAFLNSLFFLPKSFFDHRKTGDMTARLNDTQRIQKNIAYITGTVVVDMLVIAITVTFLFIYSVPIAFVSIAFIPIIVLTVLRFINPIKKQQQQVMAAYARTESIYVDNIQGVAAIKESNREGFFATATQQVFELYQVSGFTLGKIANKFMLVSEVLGVTMTVSILFLASYLVLDGELMIGEMVAIISMVGSLIPSVHRLAQTNLQIQEAYVAFDRMYEYVSVEPEYIKEQEPVYELEIFDLNVQQLSFRFPGRKAILKDISFAVNKGEVIAILGESGCGKSTLLQLLQKFYPAESGHILVNNQDVRQIPTTVWRSAIASVHQDIKIFNGTLLENVMVGGGSVQEFHMLCQQYGFDKYFSELPQGYLTLIGEEGINLSGGQKQLVAIARALFKRPQLLLLDEATSAMDRHTEHFILNLLQVLKDEMAVVMVTHRIHTAKTADRIYLMEEGRITDSGSHEKLVAKDNLYSQSLIDYTL